MSDLPRGQLRKFAEVAGWHVGQRTGFFIQDAKRNRFNTWESATGEMAWQRFFADWAPHKCMDHAMEIVVGLLASEEYSEDQFDLQNCLTEWDARFWYTDTPQDLTEGHGDTPQLAICRAATLILEDG